MFCTAEMRAIFEDRAFIGRCIETETALARAEAQVGLIPEKAAAQITTCSNLDKIDFDRLRKETEVVGYPILPLVRNWQTSCLPVSR
jgi:3-carboxy-cis,cis-muconate cycloisomerase